LNKQNLKQEEIEKTWGHTIYHMAMQEKFSAGGGQKKIPSG